MPAVAVVDELLQSTDGRPGSNPAVGIESSYTFFMCLDLGLDTKDMPVA